MHLNTTAKLSNACNNDNYYGNGNLKIPFVQPACGERDIIVTTSVR